MGQFLVIFSGLSASFLGFFFSAAAVAGSRPRLNKHPLVHMTSHIYLLHYRVFGFAQESFLIGPPLL